MISARVIPSKRLRLWLLSGEPETQSLLRPLQRRMVHFGGLVSSRLLDIGGSKSPNGCAMRCFFRASTNYHACKNWLSTSSVGFEEVWCSSSARPPFLQLKRL